MAIERVAGVPPEPSVAVLGGSGPAATLRRSVLATRPQFLTASALPVVLGSALGAARVGGLDLVAALLALAATVLMQAASNVLNDVGDELGGSDPRNTERLYPFTGGSRFIQNGIMTVAEMTRLSITLFGGALACGVVLAARHGWPVVVLGLAGLALGTLYSIPRVQLAGRGLGELAVGVAFGLLPVAGAAWLQGARIDAAMLWPGLAVAAWVAAILLINEVPDRRADAAVGKRTLPVRMGLDGTAWVYRVLQLVAFAAVLGWVLAAGRSPLAAAVPALLAALGLRSAAAISAGDRARLAGAIRATLGIHAAGCLWLAAWTAVAAL